MNAINKCIARTKRTEYWVYPLHSDSYTDTSGTLKLYKLSTIIQG